MQLVMAAIATGRSASGKVSVVPPSRPRSRSRAVRRRWRPGPSVKFSRNSPATACVEADPVLRSARAGQAGHDRAEVQLERLVEVGVRVVVGAEEALLLGVAPRSSVDRRRPAGRWCSGSAASRRRSGRASPVAPYSGDMLAIVARSASVRVERPSPKYSTKRPPRRGCAASR